MCNLCTLAKTTIPASVSPFLFFSEGVESFSWCASVRPLAASFALPPLLDRKAAVCGRHRLEEIL